MKTDFRIFGCRPSKKASLSLSINAIVVLVLAIAMLGLGLGFTKSMFKKFGEKLTVPPPDLPATKDDPVVLPSEELEIRHGEEFTFQVNYFNDHGTGKIDAGILCSDSLNNYIASDNVGANGIDSSKKPAGANFVTAPAATYPVVTAKQKVNAGTQKSFKLIIPKEATSSISSEIDVCQIVLCAPFSVGTEGRLSYDVSSNAIICKDDLGGSGAEDAKQITIKVT